MSEWSIKRDEIINVVEVLSMIPSRPGIITSEFIKVSGKKNKVKMMMASEVSGYTEIKGNGDWPFEKDIYIDRRLFDPFISAAKNIKSKSDFRFIKSGKKELTIVNGNRKAKLTCADSKAGYEDIGKTTRHEVKTEKELNTLLIAAKHCAEESTSEPEKNCVYARRSGKNIVLYATTGVLNIRAEVKSKLVLNEPIPLPLFIIDLMANPKLVGVEATKHEVILDFGIGKVWETISVEAKKKFPYKRIDNLISTEKKNSKLAFVVDAKSYGVVIERLAGYLGSVRRLDWVLTLTGKKGSSKLETIIPLGHTMFRDKIKLKKKIAYDFSVDLPFDRVIGVLGVIALTGEKIHWSFDKENRSYVKAGNIELLISRRTN
jgi:hypothetical protein